MKRVFNFIVVILLSTSFVTAQRTLLTLTKKNRNKDVYYSPGDKISFYIKDSNGRITDVITGFNDSSIVFQRHQINLNDITALHIDEKTRWWLRFKAAQILLICGSGYLVLNLINDEEITRETIAISGAAIATGILCKVLIPNRIRLSKNTRLLIIRL